MRSQPPTNLQSPDRESDDELHGRMDGRLAAEVAADSARNERRLLKVIGTVWAREAMSEARRGVDGWYGGNNIDDDGRVCGCIGLRFRVDVY
ncbi:hypothetical protein V6N12_033894 [Hibiscus sabdariffa]|uniref:Uncharacterized protein n=1 Tax=Hibiscus sabdariffa TaxID=183260 RepID=A0ABR2AE14_9ROSI